MSEGSGVDGLPVCGSTMMYSRDRCRMGLWSSMLLCLPNVQLVRQMILQGWLIAALNRLALAVSQIR